MFVFHYRSPNTGTELGRSDIDYKQRRIWGHGKKILDSLQANYIRYCQSACEDYLLPRGSSPESGLVVAIVPKTRG